MSFISLSYNLIATQTHSESSNSKAPNGGGALWTH